MITSYWSCHYDCIFAIANAEDYLDMFYGKSSWLFSGVATHHSQLYGSLTLCLNVCWLVLVHAYDVKALFDNSTIS